MSRPTDNPHGSAQVEDKTMNEIDELPNWTSGQQAVSGSSEEPEPRRGRRALFALLGLLALTGMGAIGYFVAQNQSDSDTATTAEPAAPTTDEQSDDAAITGAVDESSASDDGQGEDSDTEMAAEADGEADQADAGDGGTTEDAAADNTTDEGATADDTGPGGDDSGRTAVFRGGKLFLGGKVPSQDVADFIADKAKSVVGPENVVVEYEIDPTVVIDPGESTPLYVEDVVLFQFNSIAIDPPFFPLLDLGTLLLRQNPQATLTVVTRTDAVGSEEINLDVATKRANAVINYWLSKGVKADQLQADPRGEEGTSEDDDERTAALQRRAEFVITGLLD